MAWKIGQQVVCIDGDFPPEYDNDFIPIEKEIYTIRDVGFFHFNAPISPSLGFLLCEIVNISRNWKKDGIREQMFSVHRFRPLLNISVFDKILAEVNDKEKTHA